MRSPVQGTVVAVLVAQPATVQVGKKATVTGIRKQAQPGRVEVTARGLSGDHVLNVRHHGGPDQAVYLYTQPDLDAWTEELGDVLPSGVFGENVVVTPGNRRTCASATGWTSAPRTARPARCWKSRRPASPARPSPRTWAIRSS